MNNTHFTKTRIAPTPSGYLHLGNIYSFAITAAMAHKNNAKTLLRIDDLDRERLNPAYVQDIFDTLHFLNIPWQEGPQDISTYDKGYSQLYRLDSYRQALQQLQESGGIFACTCSRTQILQNNPSGIYPGTCRDKHIPFDTENACWRLDTGMEEVLTIKTLAGETVSATLPGAMQHFIVRKKDGYPAYQLSSLVDDLQFNIDMIVRGADLWESTLAQLYLARRLQQNIFAGTIFHHHPLLTGTGGEKLSKSAGATSVQYLRRQGKKAADIYAMIGKMTGMGSIISWQDITI